MTSARELLEQADALMRRSQAPEDEDVPVLEDVVEAGTPAPDSAHPVTPPLVAGEPVQHVATPTPPVVASEPVQRGPASTVEAPTANGASAAIAPAAGTDELPPMDGRGAGFVAFGTADLPPPQPIEAWIPGLPGGAAQFASSESEQAVHGPAPATDRSRSAQAGSSQEPQWGELREQLFATVMQRLELLTDRTLAHQLAQRIRPVVERAGAELADRISGEMRELVRACVAEAIEREISAMRDERKPPQST